MAYTGGDCVEVTCNHPTLGAYRFDPKGSEDAEVDMGGYVNVDSDDSITGSGINIITKNRKRWSVPVPPVGWSRDPDTLTILQNIQNSGLESTWTFSFIDGRVFKGVGTIMGDLKGNTNTGVIGSFKVAGGGKLEVIA